LHGESEYNTTINSDLTVSCNCQDYDGTGHIGDLRKNTFEEIFLGPEAQRLRDECQGKDAHPHLRACGDLKRLAGARSETSGNPPAASRDASGEHCALQRGLHRLRP